MTYNSAARQKAAVPLDGSFPWNVGTSNAGDNGTLGPWDVSQPGTAPAPPRNGSKYLDPYAVTLGDSLITVVRHLGTRLADLLSGATPLSGTGLLTSTGLFAGGATLLAPLVTYQARSDATFGLIAALPVYAGAWR